MYYIVRIKEEFKDRIVGSNIKNLKFIGKLENTTDRLYFTTPNGETIIIPHLWIEFMAPSVEFVVVAPEEKF